MKNTRPNILVFMSDEHAKGASGCFGSSIVRTPAIESLASDGIVFENAYCNSPMCVPSRMSFLTGRYPFKVQVYDNGSPLASEYPSYAHYLEAEGYETVLCGRMHMIGPDRTHGFGKRLYDDVSLWQSFNQTPERTSGISRGSNSHVTDRGPGYGSWQDYDHTTVDLAERYIRSKGRDANSKKPWMMTVGVMFPHFPHMPPGEYYDLYKDKVSTLELSPTKDEAPADQHPAIRELRRFFYNDKTVSDSIAREALASYYACTTFMDDCFGKVLNALNESGQWDNTVVIYTSDHGEMAGAHGIWQKQCFYEESIRIPLIMRLPKANFPRIPGPVRVESPVSLVDVFPTLLELADCREVSRLPGTSLLSFAEENARTASTDRVIFSEYQAQGSLGAFFMIKKGVWKYNYYVGHEPELFNLDDDPFETSNLAGYEQFREIQNELNLALIEITGSPEQVDKLAKENQAKSGFDRLDRRGLMLHEHLRKV